MGRRNDLRVSQNLGRNESPRPIPGPALRSWIQKVIVPALLREYLAEFGLAEKTASVACCAANARPSAEVNE
jgi:hypothetical protein